MGGFPKLGYHLGLPIVRIIIFWGLYWDPPILGNYHIFLRGNVEAGMVSSTRAVVDIQGLGCRDSGLESSCCEPLILWS